MNRSFKSRLAALEALEAQQQHDTGPLTAQDAVVLLAQCALSTVQLVAGRVTREWATGDVAYTEALDRSLSRCNSMLRQRPDLDTTTALVEVLMEQVEDDALPIYLWAQIWEKYGAELP